MTSNLEGERDIKMKKGRLVCLIWWWVVASKQPDVESPFLQALAKLERMEDIQDGKEKTRK